MKSFRLLPLLALLGRLGLTPVFAAPLPSPITTVAPIVSEELAATPATVELAITLNPHGYVTQAEVRRSTDARLDKACLAAIRQWRYTPPDQDGVAFIQPFRFGGDTIDTTPIAATRPEPRNRIAPELPENLVGLSGEVTVFATIDPTGAIAHASIAKTTHEELNPFCLEAVKHWTFRPATDHGRPIASNVYIPFRFVGANRAPTPAAKVELVDNDQLIPVRQPAPALPDSLLAAGGEASVLMTINPQGYVVDAVIRSATNDELGQLARRTVLRWKFRPIVRRGVAVTARAVQPIKFGEGSVAVTPVDQLPAVRHSVSPTLPKELEGASGFAHVVFEIDATGRVVDATITDCSHEAFRAAVLAVAKEWTFRPALRSGVAVQSRVSIPFVFGSKLARN